MRTSSSAQIASGTLFDVLDPDPDVVTIEVVAHALAMQCRFNGHCARFYSVAEHSVHVSRVAEDLLAGTGKRGVLHDAHESLIGDMIWPLKHGVFTEFPAFEDRMQAMVYEKFGLAQDERADEAVHQADMAMVQMERLHLFPRTPEADEAWAEHEGDTGIVPQHCIPQCWAPEMAKVLFLDRFREVSL